MKPSVLEQYAFTAALLRRASRPAKRAFTCRQQHFLMQTAGRLKVETQSWKKCWHMGLFFGNDGSHEIASAGMCLSFAR